MVVVRLSKIELRKKVKKSYQPHQGGQARGFDACGQHLKAVMRVHHFDNRHRTDQEEHDLRRARQ